MRRAAGRRREAHSRSPTIADQDRRRPPAGRRCTLHAIARSAALVEAMKARAARARLACADVARHLAMSEA
ncbi:MAG: hypothetical protein NZL88_12080, partial [Gaiellaceae bacterium]|nr:hypothetical protein [Gaiellaceae bacterium]